MKSRIEKVHQEFGFLLDFWYYYFTMSLKYIDNIF